MCVDLAHRMLVHHQLRLLPFSEHDFVFNVFLLKIVYIIFQSELYFLYFMVLIANQSPYYVFYRK